MQTVHKDSTKMSNSTTLDGLVSIFSTDGDNTLPSPVPLSTIVTVAACGFGILANFLVLLVIIMSPLRNSVFMNLIMFLAIFDTIFLFSVINIQRGIFGEILIRPSLLYCRFNIFFNFVTSIVSSWITVLISFERYISIFYSFKVHIYCTKKRMLVAVFTITILACASQIPLFFTCSMVFIGQRPRCLSFISDTWSDTISIFFLLIIYSIIPLVIITVLNVFLIRKVQVQGAFRARSQGQHSVSISSTKNVSLFAMMVSLCVFFAVTSLPASIISTVNHLCKFTTGSRCVVIGGWIYRIPFMLNDVNHGVNFFLYCLAGSVFRQALFQLFKCKCAKSAALNLHEPRSVRANIV